MRANRGRDTGPELAVCSALRGLGYRYRVDHPLIIDCRRRGDIVFTRRRVVVFIDGCFWHGCPEHRAAPASNAVFWAKKLTQNLRRDRDTDRWLREAGWTMLRFWEHEHPNSVVERIVANGGG